MQQNQLKPNQQFFPLKPLSKSLLWNKALNPLNTLKFYSIPEKYPFKTIFPYHNLINYQWLIFI